MSGFVRVFSSSGSSDLNLPSGSIFRRLCSGYNSSLVLLEGGKFQIIQGPSGLEEKLRLLEGLQVTDITFGKGFTMALLEEGEIITFGNNEKGQLGLGMIGGEEKGPEVVKALRGKNVVKISAGLAHAAAISDSGDLYLWGSNEFGECGVKSMHFVPKPSFFKIPGLATDDSVFDVVCSESCTVILTCNGKIYCLGNGLKGWVSELDSIQIQQITAGSSHFLALSNDGKVYGWGIDVFGCLHTQSSKLATRVRPKQLFTELGPIVSIAASNYTSLLSTESKTCVYGKSWQGDTFISHSPFWGIGASITNFVPTQISDVSPSIIPSNTDVPIVLSGLGLGNFIRIQSNNWICDYTCTVDDNGRCHATINVPEGSSDVIILNSTIENVFPFSDKSPFQLYVYENKIELEIFPTRILVSKGNVTDKYFNLKLVIPAGLPNVYPKIQLEDSVFDCILNGNDWKVTLPSEFVSRYINRDSISMRFALNGSTFVDLKSVLTFQDISVKNFSSNFCLSTGSNLSFTLHGADLGRFYGFAKQLEIKAKFSFTDASSSYDSKCSVLREDPDHSDFEEQNEIRVSVTTPVVESMHEDFQKMKICVTLLQNKLLEIEPNYVDVGDIDLLGGNPSILPEGKYPVSLRGGSIVTVPCKFLKPEFQLSSILKRPDENDISLSIKLSDSFEHVIINYPTVIPVELLSNWNAIYTEYLREFPVPLKPTKEQIQALSAKESELTAILTQLHPFQSSCNLDVLIGGNSAGSVEVMQLIPPIIEKIDVTSCKFGAQTTVNLSAKFVAISDFYRVQFLSEEKIKAEVNCNCSAVDEKGSGNITFTVPSTLECNTYSLSVSPDGQQFDLTKFFFEIKA